MIDFLRNDLRRGATNGSTTTSSATTTTTSAVGPETGKDGAKFTLLKTRERKAL